MERLDILNSDGLATGLTIDRGSVFSLKDGQYYLGVHAYIHNSSNDFLLQKRSYDKAFLPGEWDIHIGHAAAGETSRDAMIREIREEIGVSFPTADIRFAKRSVWEVHHHLVDIYFLQVDFNISQLSLNRSEVIGVKVISKNDMLPFVSGMHYRPEDYREVVIDEIRRLR